jgi:hypothetical protein
MVSEWCPGSPIRLIGFSLGGNMTLKFAGELGEQTPAALAGCLAVCPPVDLHSCSQAMRRPFNRWYDGFFCRILWNHVQDWWSVNPNAVRVTFPRVPRTLREFDEHFTAPVGGFRSVDDYYSRTSALNFMSSIRVPTLILASRNDPLIPPEPLERFPLPSCARAVFADGGHLGFFSVKDPQGDRRWLDRQVIEWILSDGSKAPHS